MIDIHMHTIYSDGDKTVELDGIECFHPSSADDNRISRQKICI